ncbi:MAG: SAM-dependent methyltransferase [Actinomycetota bacterium]|nr:SAM-dependent methyltransferase [Actinomycetota bacterium]
MQAVGEPVRWRVAWQEALYGAGGFYSSNAPAAHFRTSVVASALFAGAIGRLTRQAGLDTVVDMGAGGGELLSALHLLDPDLRLHGVDLGNRPPGLPDAVTWSHDVPVVDGGLLLANEWLDNIPCEVIESTADGPRVVMVDPAAAEESLGPSPDNADARWLDRWWPLAEVGCRAEVGRSRDEAWATAVSKLERGLAIAVDYAHTRDSRPPYGTLTGYRRGRQVVPIPDGSCDITAHVALDSCAAAAPGDTALVSQRQALRALGVSGLTPPYALGRVDPARYSRGLQGASEAAELLHPAGLGGFSWLIHAVATPLPALGD